TLHKTQRVAEFIVGLSRLTGIELKAAERIVRQKNYEALAILCRAQNFTVESFSALISHTGGSEQQTPEVMRFIGLYSKLTPQIAQRTVRFWQVREKAMSDEQDGEAAPTTH
ncbi:MAG: DUF2336 domain-containing protein, partial [Pseudomonadota bacterium]